MLCFQLMQPVDLLDESLHNICARIGCCLCLTELDFTSESKSFQTSAAFQESITHHIRY